MVISVTLIAVLEVIVAQFRITVGYLKTGYAFTGAAIIAIPRKHNSTRGITLRFFMIHT